MKYRLSPLAELDLDEIWLRVATDASPETASRLVDTIVEGFALLAAHPRVGRPRPDLHPDVRSFPIERHIIYYREESHLVKIARILHGSRDQVAAWEATGGRP